MLQIFVTKAGTAVEQQHLDRPCAQFLGPHFVLTADHRHHANAGGTNAGRIEPVRMLGPNVRPLRRLRGRERRGTHAAQGNGCRSSGKQLTTIHRRILEAKGRSRCSRMTPTFTRPALGAGRARARFHCRARPALRSTRDRRLRPLCAGRRQIRPRWPPSRRGCRSSRPA